MRSRRGRIWPGLALATQMAGCGSVALGVAAVPTVLAGDHALGPGPHFYLVNDYPGFAEVYLLLNGSRVSVAHVNGGSTSWVAIPAEFVGRLTRIVVEPGFGAAARTSRELTLWPDRHLEIRVSPSRLCVRAWSSGEACP